MLDLGLLDKALEGDGKDADETRLNAVDSTMVSDVLQAADTARIGLEKGSTDVRLLTAYALGAFVEQGPKALAGIFDALRRAVSERWHSLRPEERKERIVDGSYSKLFRSMVSHIDVHEKMQDATFKAWIRSDHDTVGGPALRASSALRDALIEALETPQSKDPLSELDARIRMHFDRVPAPAKPAPRPAPEPEPEPEPATPDESSAEEREEPSPDAEESKESAPEDRDEQPRSPDTGHAPAGTIAVSPAFAQLLRKIDAVGALLSRGDTERAAVIADDVRRTLKQFDPKVFFPDVFLPYFRLLSENIDEISPHWREIGSPRWEALAELYQVDLKAFLDG
jgi:hypothetical protein